MNGIVSLKRRQFEVGEKRMVLASSLVFPVSLTLLRLLQHPEQNNGGGLPLVVVPVIIFIVLLLIFLSSYFTSTGIQGKAAAETAVPHDAHDDHAEPEAAPAEAALQTMRAETAVAVAEEKETAVTVSEPAPSAMTLPEEPPAPVKPDDLKIIEGIGPKIEGILHEAGIKTFAQLAAAPVSQLEKIVREDAGIRIAFPDTWPEQAKLAAEGAWDTLEELQDALKGGRRE
jgi:predicted flap endonuclease-1-like 5' DNA nuclease